MTITLGILGAFGVLLVLLSGATAWDAWVRSTKTEGDPAKSSARLCVGARELPPVGSSTPALFRDVESDDRKDG